MDASPDPTMVFTDLKDLHMFLGSSRTSVNRPGWEARRLDFSAVSRDSSTLSLPSPNASSLARGQKRHHDSLVGFDVTKKIREKDSEIINTQATVTRLQGRLHEVEVTHKKAKLEADAEIRTLQCRQRRDKELIDDLQYKLKKMLKGKEEGRESVKSARAQWDTAHLEAGARVNKMQQTYLEESAKMQEKINALQEQVTNLEEEVAEKTSKVTLAESHTEVLEVRLVEVQEKHRRAEESQAQGEEQRRQLNQALSRVRDLELQHEGFKEAQKQQEVLEAAMFKLPSLEKELAKLKENNKFLRDTSRNTQLMEEKLTSALQQVNYLEKRCEDRASHQAKAEMYKESLDRFECIVEEEFGLGRRGTPEDLQGHLRQLRKGDKVLTDSLGQLRASYKSLEDGRNQEVAELNLLKTKLQKQEHMTQHQAGQNKRFNRRLLLVSKERDSLKSILNSYESEATINYSVVGQDRVRGLEGQVKLYRQEVERLNVELQEACSSTTSPAAAAAVSSQQRMEDAKKITGLEEKVQSLEEQMGGIRQEKEVLELRLEHRALKGDYDPTKTKVLHFKDNPHARALENRKSQIEKLQTENESLQQRVRLLEQGETLNLTQRVGVKVAAESHKEVVELQEKVSRQERQNKRLMEAFQRKAREMREIVYRLTGYRVDSCGEKQYKLIHMYAESPDDYFLFEHTPAKEIQLLETEFSSTIDDLIDAYLRHENSYPAFLSAVTLDLFNRQTKYQEQSTSEEEEEEEEEDEEEVDDRKGNKRGDQKGQKPDVVDDDDDDDEDDDDDDDDDACVILD